MKIKNKILLALLVTLATTGAAFSQSIPPTLWITEDGTIRANPPKKVIVPNGSIASGVVTITSGGGGGTGTVTSISVVTANGVSASCATCTTTPALTFVLGAITPATVNGLTVTPTTSGVLTIANSKTLTASNTLTFTGTDSSSVAFGTGGTVAYTANNLSVFASTTSAQLAGVLSDETGTGVAVFNDTPTIATPAITTSATVTRNSLGTTNATGLELTNTTVAAAGAQQISPDFVLTGQGWKTTATAASQTVKIRQYALPVQGTTAPTVNWVLGSDINGGGFTQHLSVTSGNIFQIGTTGGTLYFGNSNHSITASDASNTMSFAPSGGTTAMALVATFLRVPQGNGADAAGIQSNANSGNIDMSFFPQARGGNTGTGGAIYLHGGTGSTSGTPSVGGASHLYGGAGGTNQNGGNVYIYGGALNGSGVDGDIYLGYNGSASRGFVYLGATQRLVWGSGSPESVITAPVGSMYLRSDGGAGTTLYIKESGSGNTGWVGK